MNHKHSFLEYLKSLNYSPRTIQTRAHSIDQFFAWNSKELKDLTEQDLRNFLNKPKYKTNTRNIYLLSLKQFFNYLEKNFIIFSNPCDEIHCQKVKTLPQVLTEEEVQIVLESIDTRTKEGKRHKAIFELLYSTALRRGEALSLNLSDLDLTNSTLRVLGKGKKERLVPFGQTAKEALKNYLQFGRLKRSKSSLIFLNNDGSPLSTGALEQAVNMFKKKTGIKFSCHTLRRSCATHLLNNGASPLLIAELLGHAQLKTLSHYLKVSVKEIKEMHQNSLLGN